MPPGPPGYHFKAQNNQDDQKDKISIGRLKAEKDTLEERLRQAHHALENGYEFA